MFSTSKLSHFSLIFFLCDFSVPNIFKKWVFQEKAGWISWGWAATRLPRRARDFWDDFIVHLSLLHIDWPFQCGSPEMCSWVSWNDRRLLFWQPLWALWSLLEPSGNAELEWHPNSTPKVPNFASMVWRLVNREPLHWVPCLHGLYGDSWSGEEAWHTSTHIGQVEHQKLELWNGEGDYESGPLDQGSDCSTIWVL